jgi:hypothetical protein
LPLGKGGFKDVISSPENCGTNWVGQNSGGKQEFSTNEMKRREKQVAAFSYLEDPKIISFNIR